MHLHGNEVQRYAYILTTGAMKAELKAQRSCIYWPVCILLYIIYHIVLYMYKLL